MPQIDATDLLQAMTTQDTTKIRAWYISHPEKDRQLIILGTIFDPIRWAITCNLPNVLAVLLEPGHEVISDFFPYVSMGMNRNLYSQILKHGSVPDSPEQLKNSLYQLCDKLKYPNNISQLITSLFNDRHGVMCAVILKIFLSPKPLPANLELKNWMIVVLGIMYSLVFERFPDNVGSSLESNVTPIEWQNGFANWLAECGLIPNADKNSLPRSFAHLISLDKKRQWAVAIYSDPTAELIDLMRPILISKSYKTNLEQQQFLKNCAKHLKSHDGLRPYLTEYSDYFVIDDPIVWLLLNLKIPEDLPRNLNAASEVDTFALFKCMRWFMSKPDFLGSHDSNYLIDLRFLLRYDLHRESIVVYDHLTPPLINQTSFEFIFHVIEFLVMTPNPEPSKKSAYVELLHVCTEKFPALWWILSKLYDGHVITESLWPYRNAKSARACFEYSDSYDTYYPLVQYFLTRSTKSEIVVSSNSTSHPEEKKSKHCAAVTFFTYWLEKKLSSNFVKYGIAESVVPQNYDPFFGLEAYNIAYQNFSAGENSGLFYDPINHSVVKPQLYPTLQPLTKQQLATTIGSTKHKYREVIPLIFSSIQWRDKDTQMSRDLVNSSLFPQNAREQLLAKNSINNIPLNALANLLSPNERYLSFVNSDYSKDFYLPIIETLLLTNPRSYLSSNDDRVLLLNCRNRLKNVDDIIPMLTSYNDFLLLDHSEIWIHLSRHIPLDMQTFFGKDAFETNYLVFLMLAKWWMAKNGEHKSINAYLDSIGLMLTRLKDANQSHLQIKMELLCYVVRTLLNRDEKRKDIRDGCKKILNFYAAQYPALHWLLAKLYEGNLLTGSNFLKNYPADHRNKFGTRLGEFEKLATFFPILNSIALNKHREPITTTNQFFDFKDTGLKFLAWLELYFLFNLKNFGINQNIIATAYPTLQDAAWRAEFQNKFTDELRLGREDGLFYSLPDANAPAHIQLEPAIATAPPDSVEPTPATSTVSSRASSPTLSRKNSMNDVTPFSPQGLQDKLQVLLDQNSDYAAVAHIDITTREDFNNIDDDNDVVSSIASSDSEEPTATHNSPEPLLVANSQTTTASLITPSVSPESDSQNTTTSLDALSADEQSPARISITEIAAATSSSASSVTENLAKELAALPVEQSELISFPVIPVSDVSDENKPEKVAVALADSHQFKPVSTTAVMKPTPVVTNKSHAFFPPAEPSKPVMIPDLESIETVQEKMKFIEHAFEKESENLALLAKITGHTDGKNAMTEKVLQNLNALFALKTQLEKQVGVGFDEQAPASRFALENRN